MTTADGDQHTSGIAQQPVPGADPSAKVAAERGLPDGLLRYRRHATFARCALVLVAAALGLVQGLVWASIAPTAQVKVFADGSYLSLPTADYHLFVGLALFACAGAAVGVILGVAAWRVRAIRGAATLAVVFGASVVGSALAYGSAMLAAPGINPADIGATGSESIVHAAATLGSPLVMLAEPLLAVGVYTFLAAWDGRADLGSSRMKSVAVGYSTMPTSEPSR